MQDTWRASPKLTLNYGLRLDVINPQTVNEAGNGGFLDLDTGEIQVAGVGGIGLNGDVKNSINWAPRLGATYQLDREDGAPGGLRPQLRHRRVRLALRPRASRRTCRCCRSRSMNAPNNFDAVFNLAQGPPAPVFPAVPANGRFPLPNGVRARARCRDKQRLADGRRLERHGAASADRHAVGRGRVRRQPRARTCSSATDPAINVNQPTIVGFAQGVSTDLRRPFFAGNVANAQGFGGAYGWTQGIDYFCNCADQPLQLAADEGDQALRAGLLAVQRNYTLQHAASHDGSTSRRIFSIRVHDSV